jgi:ribosomal-protein-alanine N-acetyltransferase
MVHLKSTRLELREAKTSDTDALIEYQYDPRYLEHYDSKPDARMIISQAQEWASQSPRQNYQFVITLIGSPTAIGCAGVRSNNYPRNEGELGIELNPKFWGVGFATEAMRSLTKFARSLGLTKLHAITKKSNIGAQSLVESEGFQKRSAKDNDIFFCKSLVDVQG